MIKYSSSGHEPAECHRKLHNMLDCKGGNIVKKESKNKIMGNVLENISGKHW